MGGESFDDLRKRPPTPIKKPSKSSHNLLAPVNTLDSTTPTKRVLVPSSSTKPNPSYSNQSLFPLKINNLPQRSQEKISSAAFSALLTAPSEKKSGHKDDLGALTAHMVTSDAPDVSSSEDENSSTPTSRPSSLKASGAHSSSISSKSSMTASTPKTSRMMQLESKENSETFEIPISHVRYGNLFFPSELEYRNYLNLKIQIYRKTSIIALSGRVSAINKLIHFPFAAIHKIQMFIPASSTSTSSPIIDFVLGLDLNVSEFSPNSHSPSYHSVRTLRVTVSEHGFINWKALESIFTGIVQKSKYRRILEPEEYGLFELNHKASPSLETLSNSSCTQYSEKRLRASTSSSSTSNPVSSPDVFESQMRRLKSSRKVHEGKDDHSTSQLRKSPRCSALLTKKQTHIDSITYVDPEFETDGSILFTYPEGEMDSITVTSHELERLSPGIWLNDTLIDFDLKFIQNSLPETLKDRIHIFSSFFYKRLSSAPFSAKSAAYTASPSTLNSPSTAISKKSGYDLVRSWTRKVQIFQKDFLVVPINENLHWYVAIICHPNRILVPLLNETEDETEEETEANDEDEKLPLIDLDEKQPYVNLDQSNQHDQSTQILIFDSLGLMNRKCTPSLINRLRNYLILEAADKLQLTAYKGSCEGHLVKVPQQENYTDCGCFLLQFVDEFFRNGGPEDSLKQIINQKYDLSDWFPNSRAQARRSEMRKRVEEITAYFTARIASTPKKLPLEECSSDIEEIVEIP